MNSFLLALLGCLLVLLPIASGIKCYYCPGGVCGPGTSGAVSRSTDVGSSTTYVACYSQGTGGFYIRAGLNYNCSVFSANSANNDPTAACCSTDNCNGAKATGASLLMASIAGIIALARSM